MSRLKELRKLNKVATGSVNEVLVENARIHAFDVLRSSFTTQRQVTNLLIEVQRELVKQLLSKSPRTFNDRRRLSEFFKSVTEEIKSAYRGVGQKVRGELIELATIEAQFASQSINYAVGVKLIDTFLTRTQIEKLVSNTMIEGAPSKNWWARQSQAVANNFKDQVRLGMAQGDTLQQLAQRIKGGMRKGERVPGVPGVRGVTAPGRGFLRRATKNAEALVRTSFQQVSNEARREVYRANSGVIKGIQHISTLDSRTTNICSAYAGAAWDLDYNPIGDISLPYNSGVPRHWGCRSVEAPLLKSLDEILGVPDMPKIPKGTQSSIDGQIPGDVTFDRWLGGKPESFQNKMLGKGKAELWRSGQITLQDLVDPVTGDALTLSELRASL